MSDYDYSTRAKEQIGVQAKLDFAQPQQEVQLDWKQPQVEEVLQVSRISATSQNL